MIDLILNFGQYPLVVRLGWTLLHFLWQAAIVAAGLAVMLRFLHQSNSRYLAGCLALTAMSALPVVTWTHLSHNVQRDFQRDAGVSDVPPVVAVNTDTSAQQTGTSLPADIPANADSTLSKAATFGGNFTPRWIVLLLPIVIACWTAGVVVMAARLLMGWLYVESIRYRGTKPPGPKWQDRLALLAKRLKIRRRVRLLQSALVDGPTQIGWLRPVVLVPASILTSLTPQELDGLLAHELAHIRRHDYLVNLLQSVVETFLFYHPAVWWVSGVIRMEREHCCDDVALDVCGHPQYYLDALNAAEQLRGAALALGAGGGSLARRVERICQREASPHVRNDRWSLSALFAVGLIVTIFTVSLLIPSEAAKSDRENRQAPPNLPMPRPHAMQGPHPIALNDLGLTDDSLTLREVVLEEHGQVLISSRIHRDEEFQELLIRPMSPGPVVIQVIPQSEGFRPYLTTLWPSERGTDGTDGDLASGRGKRPLQVVNYRLPAPQNWIRVKIWNEHGGTLVGKYGDYVVHIRKPKCLANDFDAETLGIESSPVVLDSSGYGRAHGGKVPSRLPAIEYSYDEDTFQIRSTSHARLSVTVDGTVGEIDPYVQLYDADRRPIAEAPTRGPRRSVSLSIDHPKPGAVYYLAVSSYDWSTSGVYIVQVRQRPSINAEEITNANRQLKRRTDLLAELNN